MNRPIFGLALTLALTGGMLRAATPAGSNIPSGPVPLQVLKAGDPVVFKPGAQTEAGWRREESQWMEKHLLPVITKGWEAEPWRDRALEFVRERLPRMQHRSTWGRGFVDFKISGASVLEAGCRDPWVRLWDAWDRQDEGFDADKDLPAMEQALREIRESVKDPAILRFAALPLIQEGRAYPTDRAWRERRDEISEAFMQWTEHLGRSPCYGKEDEGQLYRHISAFPTRRTPPAGAVERLVKAGTLPGWLTDTMLGGQEIALAWKSRGDDVASEVTEEGWEGFREHLALARQRLVAAWKARPDQPYAAADMIKVVMGGDRAGGESARLWFNRSTSACFDYLHAYGNYVLTLLPRWGGSHQELLDFGFACMDCGHMETDTPLMLPRTISTVGYDLDAYDKVYDMPGVAGRLKKLNTILLKGTLSRQEMMDRRSHIMLDSWFLRDWRTGLDASRANHSEFTPAVDSRMSKLALDRVRIATDLAILGEADRETARTADEKEREGELAAAVKLWKQTLAEFKGPDWIREGVEGRLRAAERRMDYEGGKWVQLPVRHPGDWDQLQGEWEVVEGQGLSVIEDSDTGVQLVSYPLPLGEQFELRAKVRLTGGGSDGHPPCLTLSAGFNRFSNFAAQTVAAEITPDGVSGFFGKNSYNHPHTPRIQVSTKPEPQLELYLRRQNEKLTFTINGATVFEDSEETTGAPDWERGIISIGACQLADGSRLIIQSVEAHRLP
jgi:hypothetical protein